MSNAYCNALQGWLVLDKPLGLSSTQALSKVRWILQAQKAGHGGTLDPLATGILPIAFGETTKAISYVMQAKKIYQFTIGWGELRSSDDGEGEVIQTHPYRPSEEEIRAILPRFIGRIEQVPPAFSALKVDGRRAYDLARQGADVEMKPRAVDIHALKLCPDSKTFEVVCGKGTYVRALARDLAFALGTVGYVQTLRRVQVGPFNFAHAVTLDDVINRPSHEIVALLHPLEQALSGLTTFSVEAEQALYIHQGKKVHLSSKQMNDFHSTYPKVANNGAREVALLHKETGQMVAMVMLHPSGEVRVIRGFNVGP